MLTALLALGCGTWSQPPHRRPAAPVPDGEIRFTFAGHATMLIESGGHAVLTDPHLTSAAAIWPRFRPPGLRTGELPPLSAVVVSHPHFDHLDRATLSRLTPGTPLLVGPGSGSLIPGHLVAHELAPWQHWTSGPVTITAVPARHPARGRYLLDRHREAVGFVITIGEWSIYFAGDTAFQGSVFAEIRARLHPHVALLPIGAYSPRVIMRHYHMDPTEALAAFDLSGAQHFIPIHWGSFQLSFESIDRPAVVLRELIARRPDRDRIIIVEPGASATLR